MFSQYGDHYSKKTTVIYPTPPKRFVAHGAPKEPLLITIHPLQYGAIGDYVGKVCSEPRPPRIVKSVT